MVIKPRIDKNHLKSFKFTLISTRLHESFQLRENDTNELVILSASFYFLKKQQEEGEEE
jgi:hypothetical protein